MSELEKNFEIKIGSEKNFGYTFSIIFFILSIYPFIHSKPINLYFLLTSIVILIITLVKSSWLKKPNIIWFKFGILIGHVMAPIIMAFVYILTVIPVGVILKILNIDIMNIKIKKNENTYWIDKDNRKYRTMKNQY